MTDKRRKKINKQIMAFIAAGVLSAYLADVSLAGVWQKEERGFYYQNDDGSRLVSAMTPDGYYVDDRGIWLPQTLNIMGQTVTAPEKFRYASENIDWALSLSDIRTLNQTVVDALDDKRAFHLYADKITYVRVSSKTESTILELQKDPQTNGYILAVSADLGDRSGDIYQISSYDYAVMQLLCTQISSRPVELIEAVYSSWQGGDNTMRLVVDSEVAFGDCIVALRLENGGAVYTVRAR
jgi:hypothetical protein